MINNESKRREELEVVKQKLDEADALRKEGMQKSLSHTDSCCLFLARFQSYRELLSLCSIFLTLHLFELDFNYVSDQFWNLPKFLCKLMHFFFSYFPHYLSIIRKHFRNPFGKSFIWNMNSSGSKIEPCGTPLLTLIHIQKTP